VHGEIEKRAAAASPNYSASPMVAGELYKYSLCVPHAR
jgi:hypothetical protein